MALGLGGQVGRGGGAGWGWQLGESQCIGVSWVGEPSGSLSKDSLGWPLGSWLPGSVVEGDGVILV